MGDFNAGDLVRLIGTKRVVRLTGVDVEYGYVAEEKIRLTLLSRRGLDFTSEDELARQRSFKWLN